MASVNVGTKNLEADTGFTQNVINAMGPKTSPRLRHVMTSLIRHVHDFAREVDLSVDEWMAGVELINWAGQMSNDRRNEGQLLCDVIGLESYVSILIHVVLVSSQGTDGLRFRVDLLTTSRTKRLLKVRTVSQHPQSWDHFSAKIIL
jgi:hypothetical protein